jgi:septal ring factor EnvC (AmiA/AmiB activator)
MVRNTIPSFHGFVLEALIMPKAPSSNSTARRLHLATVIDTFGSVMPVACSNCRSAGLVCKVHVRSGRCNECNRSNAKNCNIRISENEWNSILEDRRRLQARLEELEKEKSDVERALRDNADRAAEAISVEGAEIQRLEQEEASASSNVLAMSPFTWSAVSGLDDSLWEAPVPGYLGDPVT